MFLSSQRFWPLVVICSLASVRSFATETTVEFDTSMLKARGLDPSLGAYFAETPRFTPGVKEVNVVVNGTRKGKVAATFGPNGALCATPGMLQGAGLVVPSDLSEADKKEHKENARCYDYTHAYPGSVITPVPAQEELDIIVPKEALDLTAEGGLVRDYATGGTAGILNYSAFTTHNTSSDDSSESRQMMLEEGLNIHDWILRGRQSMTEQDGSHHTDSLYAYLQHTFVNQKKIFQAGQINTAGSVFAGTAIYGMQFMPEDALNNEDNSGVMVSGIARSAQARVEVRQSGRLIFSTLVPAGAFTLNDVPVISNNTGLDVTVTETDGSSNHFEIPAEAINSHQLRSPSGLSAAIGRYASQESDEDSPLLATVSDGWKLTPWLNLGSGLLASQDYNSAAVTLDTIAFRKLLLSTTLRESDDQKHDIKGHSTTFTASYIFGSKISTDISLTRYSSGYRDLEDSLSTDDDFQQYQGQYSAGLHFSLPNFGSLSLRYAQDQAASGDSGSEYVSAAWGKTFGHISLNVSWQHSLNDDAQDEHNSDHFHEDNGDTVFVNFSMPLGEQRVSAFMHTLHHSTNSGIQTNGDIGHNSNYSLSVDRDIDARETGFNAAVNSNLHYTRLGVSAGMDGSDERNYSMAVTGGIVAHKDGVTFSPWPVKDTFAIIDAGKDLPNMRITTSSGDVWTDHWGRAVVPSVNPYHKAKVELDPESLPENVDVENGYGELAAGRGAVGHVRFNTLKVQRAMLHVRMADGSVLHKGSTIVDGGGNYTATVVDDGLVFIENVSHQPALYLVNSNNQRVCKIDYTISTDKSSRTFENITGECK